MTEGGLDHRDVTASVCRLHGVRADDFFKDIVSGDPWSTEQRIFDEDLIRQTHAGTMTNRSDVEVAVALARLVHDEFQERATSDSPRLSVPDSRAALAALRSVLGRLGVPFLPPFSDFATFYQYWRREGMTGAGSWGQRRAYLAELFNPIHDVLADIEAGSASTTLAQPVTTHLRTGWTRVDEEVAELRRHFHAAQSPQDYRNVGNDCVAVMERLSEAAYSKDRHLRDGEVEPPIAQTKARLERVVEVDLTGPSNVELRKSIRATIEMAQAVNHRTPDRRNAGIAADAVILLANMLRRSSHA